MSAESNSPSSSGFIIPDSWSNEWSDLTLLHERRNCLIYSAIRYDRRFLLKALRPEHRALTEYRLMQQREFRIGISLSHPNVATTYSFEPIERLGECIIQEYVEGQTLTQWLSTNPSWKARERVAHQLQDAMNYLHTCGLTHRDLKGDNILITHNGSNVKLIDFGLSEKDDNIYSSIEDIHIEHARALELLRTIFPRRYAFVRNIIKLLPFVLSVILFTIATWFYYSVHVERQAEKQEEQLLIDRVQTSLTKHYADLQAAADANPSFLDRIEALSTVAQEGWQVRDSLMNLYPDDELRRNQIYTIWTNKTTEFINNLHSEP